MLSTVAGRIAHTVFDSGWCNRSAAAGLVALLACSRPDAKQPGSFTVTLRGTDLVAVDTGTGRATLHQCSREAPRAVASLFTADSTLFPEAARTIQADLDRRLREEAARDSAMGKAWTGKTLAFRAQVVGIGRKTDSVLYINGFLRDPQSDSTWRTFAVVACDGGLGFFGAEYSPATGRLSAFTFNGRG